MLKVTFLNVGYGEAILLECYKDNCIQRILIDGGSARPEEYSGSSGRIPVADYLAKKGITEIDVLISTHIHEDHIAGLEDVIKNCKIGKFFHNFALSENMSHKVFKPRQDRLPDIFLDALNSYGRIWLRLKASCVPQIPLGFGEKHKFCGSALELEVLGPSKEVRQQFWQDLAVMYDESANVDNDIIDSLDRSMNQNSLVLKITYNGRSILLPSDVNNTGISHLRDQQEQLSSDILKVSHHGQKDSINDWIANAVSPDYVVTCASSDFRYNSSNRITYETILNNKRNTSKETEFIFTDAVVLPPFSDETTPRNGVEFIINDDIAWKYLSV